MAPATSARARSASRAPGPLRLVVAEKPSVARDLARVLGATRRGPGCFEGEGLVVSWCVGHVAELQEPHAYSPAWRAWSASTLPMLPERFVLRPSEHVAGHWPHLRSLMQRPDVGMLVNACDAGREGELIFRYAMELAGCRRPVLRLWLNAMTDAAIRAAWQQLRPGDAYDALGDAARCRAEADWLVGLNATRALTLRCRQLRSGAELMTVGRVQTPTLAMLVQREAAIEAFVPEPYWQVACTFAAQQAAVPAPADADADADAEAEAGTHGGAGAGAPSQTFRALYTRPTDGPAAARPGGPPSRQDAAAAASDGPPEAQRLPSAEAAQAIAAAVRAKEGRVRRIWHREREVPPPPLYDLTALQREANIRFGLTAAATLEAAQALYEQHKALTYPRTDSRYLPATMAEQLPALLRRLAAAPSPHAGLVAPLVRTPPAWREQGAARIVRDAAVTDHHAIVPTGRPPPHVALTAAQRQVYDLVARRFIASFYEPACMGHSRIEVRVGEHLFVARGQTQLRPGWHVVEPQPRPAGAALPVLAADAPLDVSAAEVRAGATAPPPRLSEAALLGAMARAGCELDAPARAALQDAGLGTPATRAAIIENLKRRALVAVDGRSLRPSAQGRALLQALPWAALKSAELTGEWEAKLAQVARGALRRDAFMHQVRGWVGQMVADILSAPIDPTALGPAPRPTGVSPPAAQAGARPGSGGSPGRAEGACPRCGEPLVHGPRAITCQKGRACSFVIFRTVAGRALGDEDVQTLLRGASTPVLQGFVSRAGRPFVARLQLDADGRVALAFGRAPVSPDASPSP